MDVDSGFSICCIYIMVYIILYYIYIYIYIKHKKRCHFGLGTYILSLHCFRFFPQNLLIYLGKNIKINVELIYFHIRG
jgi:hypothetical protein